jgi:hypothetical protein
MGTLEFDRTLLPACQICAGEDRGSGLACGEVNEVQAGCADRSTSASRQRETRGDALSTLAETPIECCQGKSKIASGK